jgi:pimeloyl-ACP methyl ester carboxylesterase
MKRKILRQLVKGLLFVIIGCLLIAQLIMKNRTPDNKAKKDFSMKGVELIADTFKVNDFELHYAKTGNDSLPTLFFIHGSPDSWSRYEVFMQDKDLLSKFRMIAIDRPGFGYSQFGDAKNLEGQSNLIGPFVRSIKNNKPIYCVGHSYGGAVVVKLQVDHKDLFDGLVLLAAAVDPKQEKPEKWRFIMKTFPLKYFLPGAYRPSNTELVYLKKDLKDLEKEWEKITCPVWILHGDKDTYVPVANSAYAKYQLINAKAVHVKILPRAEHFITHERYEEVKEVLMKLPI